MRSSRVVLFLAIAMVWACSDEGPVSGPGTLTATLTSPNGPEGAALILLVGDGVGAVTAAGTTEVFSRIEASGTRVVLINQTGGELSFQVAVSDTLVRPQAVIEEVAAPDDEIRPVLAEYMVEFHR